VPAQNLIDFEKLDLSRTLFGRDAIERHCQQRGTFAMIDGVLHFERGGGPIVGFKDLALDAWWAKDHVPGRPIFPGVLQCEGAAQLASFDYLERTPSLEGKFIGFAGLDGVRFRGLVQPPARIIYVARAVKLRSNMFVYDAQAFVERNLVFEGQIIGMLV
jgi:3-hydroxymyristoyl/3-hydroxydecanoyl-(acyl carrier protein) dehydratase